MDDLYNRASDGDDYTWQNQQPHKLPRYAGTCAEQHKRQMDELRADVVILTERLTVLEGVLRRWTADS